MEDITPWTLWNDLQTNSHSKLSRGKLQSSNQTPVCLDVFTGMFCFCSIKSWTFSSLNKCSVGLSQLWASPAGGGKNPSKQVWSPCSWYPGEINPSKQHSWNKSSVCPCGRCCHTSTAGRLWTKQLWDFHAVPVAAMPRTMQSTAGVQELSKGGVPQALPGLLFALCSFCSPIYIPQLWSCWVPRGHWDNVTNCRHCKCPQSGQEMQLFNEPCCHYSKMTQGLP